MPNEISEIVLEFFGIKGAKLPPGAERFVVTAGADQSRPEWKFILYDYLLSDYRNWHPHAFEGFALIMRGLWQDECKRQRATLSTVGDELGWQVTKTVYRNSKRQVKIWTKIILGAQAERGKGEGDE
jgi:hypothetical protein